MKPHDGRPGCSWGALTTPVAGGNRAGFKQSRRFLETVEDNFFTRAVDEPARGGVLLDLSLTNKEELIREVKADGNLGCSVQGLVKFKKLREECKTNRRVTTLGLRTMDYGLLRDLLGRNPRVMAHKGRETLGQLVDLQGHLPLNRTVHSNVQKVKQAWKKAGIDEQRSPEEAQTHTHSESRDELLGRNTETWPTHAGMEMGKPKLGWTWIW